MQGEPLSEAVGQPLELSRVIDLAISLASTLAEVHSRNVIHKDIKPSNIILYSLGVTLYELLTGQRPFQGRDALEWFHAHMAHTPRPPHELNPQVSPALSAIVMKLLAKVAEERYQSAEGLKADLEQCRKEPGPRALEGFTPGAHDAPSGFQLPQRLYGARPRSPPCARASSASLAQPGRSCSWSVATRASASPRW